MQPNCASRIGGTGRKASTIRRAVKVSQLLGVSGRCACKASLLHIHCTTSCTLPVKLWLKPHLKRQLTSVSWPFCRRYRRLKAQNVPKPTREHRLEVQTAVFPPSHKGPRLSRRQTIWGGPPPDFTLFFHLVCVFILERFLERFWRLSGASFSTII